MIVEAVPGRTTPAIRDVLLSHGWEGILAFETAAALEPWAYHLRGLSAAETEALLQVTARFGLELLTGEGWALLTGSRTRFSAMARSWSLPPELRELAVGIGQGLPADPPGFWLVGRGPVTVGEEPVWLGLEVADREYLEGRAGADDIGALAGRAEASGLGLLLTASEPARAVEQLAEAMDLANRAGAVPERVALDPAWGPGAPDPGLIRALGRPIVYSGDDPVGAVLAWERGARVFRSTLPELLGRALGYARQLGA